MPDLPPALPSDLVARLRAAGCVYAEEEAALLVAEARDADHLERMLVARTGGLPLEQVVGWAEFAGLRVAVGPGVFVPRRRTTLLLDLALDHLAASTDTATRPSPVVVDLCCGTGALAAAVLARRPDVDVHAADLDPDATAVARRNLPPDRVHTGDLCAALPGRLRGRVDVLLANAPYVPTDAIAAMPPEARDHEHRVALDGGPDGLDVHRRVATQAARWLAPDGVLLIEVAPSQVAAARELLAAVGLTAERVDDPDRDATAVRARR